MPEHTNFIKELKLDNKPRFCTLCGGKLVYRSLGEYKCEQCNEIVFDDYGKVRAYIDNHGPSPAIAISEGTGVSLDKINEYLKQGRIEIPEGSDIYIPCERCGTDIRYGRFCPACAAQLSKNLQGAFEAGEVPKNRPKREGKMRFIGREKNRY